MMRRGFVQRRLQIVAQRGGQRRFVAGLHRHRIDQRREQAFAFGMQQIAQRLHFGGAGAALRVRRLPAASRAAASAASAVVELRRARRQRGRAAPCRGGARRFGLACRRAARRARFAAASIACVQPGLGVGQAGCWWFPAAPRPDSRPRSWLALLAFQSASSAVSVSSRRSASASVSRQFARIASSAAADPRRRSRGGASASACFLATASASAAAGVVSSALFALDIGVALGDQLADALGGFAGAGFFRRPAVRAATIRR